MVSPEWLAAATALAAAVVGPLVTIYATKKQNQITLRVARDQITASTVSASRQRWIDALRDALSEFLAASAEELMQAVDGVPWADGERAAKLTLLRARIALLINPKEQDHRELLSMIDNSLSLVSDAKNPSAIGRGVEVHQAITAKAQVILKREWERVKKGELVSSEQS